MSEDGTWESLVYDNEYEIYSGYPYPIRRKGKEKIISEFIDKGYHRMMINQKHVYKHRLIALQWIENDDPNIKTQVDHISRDKLDNRIENLRWVSPSENGKNKDKVIKRKNEYLDELPEHAIQVCDYDDIILDRYYFDLNSDQLLLETKTKIVRYKILLPYLLGNRLVINLNDENCKIHKKNYTKFINHLNEVL